MSIHPSLAESEKDKKQRSVLKRTERIKILKERNLWHEGDKVCGLPKIKTVRLKIKKEKGEKKETEAGATTTASATTPGTEAKETKSPATPKAQEKK